METFVLKELSMEEIKENNGGDFGIGAAILIGLAIAAGSEVFSDWENFKRGFAGLEKR